MRSPKLLSGYAKRLKRLALSRSPFLVDRVRSLLYSIDMSLPHALVRSLATNYHTPLYVFVEDTIRSRCREVRSVLAYPHAIVRYACKALTIGAVLRIIREEGIWIDASSLNEVKRAILAGFDPSQVGYTGESASLPVFAELLKSGVTMNCSSLDQMRLLGRLAPGSKLSFRLNPGEGHGANNKVNTGGPASKHGIYIDQIDEVRRVAREYSLVIDGVHTHVGSGTDLSHWLRINSRVLEVARTFENLSFINLGGGLPVVYNPETDTPMPLREWGAQLSDSMYAFAKEYGKEVRFEIEPGRFLVAESGYLVAEVQNIKKTPDYTFALLNTGFNHNPRPAMYGSYHEDGELLPRLFPEMRIGDLMVMGHVGAYSHAMKSEYNSMNLPASVLLQTNGTAKVIERRGTLEDIIRREAETF